MHITVPESCDVLQCVVKAVCSQKKNVLCAASAPALSPYDSRRTENCLLKMDGRDFCLEISGMHAYCKVTSDGIAQQLGLKGEIRGVLGRQLACIICMD